MQYWCENCQEETECIPEDQGIGAYEFWGVKGVDKQMVMVCTKCEEVVEYSYAEYKADQDDLRADYLYDKHKDERDNEWN